MPIWLHVLACVVVPAVWGGVMYLAFNVVDRRRTRRSSDDVPPIDYSI